MNASSLRPLLFGSRFSGFRFSRFRYSSLLFQVQLQKAFRHLLDPRIVVPPHPGRTRQIELQVAMCDGLVIAFANIPKN
jgi:hypothetical protein